MDTQCPRCGADLRGGSTMSWFNSEMICLDCKQDEQGAPGYSAAHAREEAEVLQGNTRFVGVGLSEADHAYLAACRAARAPCAPARPLPARPLLPAFIAARLALLPMAALLHRTQRYWPSGAPNMPDADILAELEAEGVAYPAGHAEQGALMIGLFQHLFAPVGSQGQALTYLLAALRRAARAAGLDWQYALAQAARIADAPEEPLIAPTAIRDAGAKENLP